MIHKSIKITRLMALFAFGFMSACVMAKEALTHAIGVENFYYDYTEVVDNSYFMSLRGPMLSVFGHLQYQPDHWQTTGLKFEGRYAHSLGDNLHYKSNGTGEMDESSSYVEFRGLTFFNINNDFKVYVGPGIRYLVNDTDGKRSSTGAAGYLRTNTLFYGAVGVEHEAGLAHRWRMVSHAEFDYLFQGWQYSGIYPGIHNKQDDGYGVRLGVKFIRPCKSYEYAVGPFFRYWKIDDSDTVIEYSPSKARVVGYMEPQNTTKEIGIQFSVSMF